MTGVAPLAVRLGGESRPLVTTVATSWAPRTGALPSILETAVPFPPRPPAGGVPPGRPTDMVVIGVRETAVRPTHTTLDRTPSS